MNKRRRKRSKLLTILAIILIIFVGIFCFNVASKHFSKKEVETKITRKDQKAIPLNVGDDGNLSDYVGNTDKIKSCTVDKDEVLNIDDQYNISVLKEGTAKVIVEYDNNQTEEFEFKCGNEENDSIEKGTRIVLTLDNDNSDSGMKEIYFKYGYGFYMDPECQMWMGNATRSAYDMSTPRKNGYKFGGYYTSLDEDGKKIINEKGYIVPENITNTMYTKDSTIYAKWIEDENVDIKEGTIIEIALDNDKANSGMKKLYFKYGYGFYMDETTRMWMGSSNRVGYNITVPKKTGYKFNGYYSSKNGKGKQIIDEKGYIVPENITNTMYTKNSTIYAYLTKENDSVKDEELIEDNNDEENIIEDEEKINNNEIVEEDNTESNDNESIKEKEPDDNYTDVINKERCYVNESERHIYFITKCQPSSDENAKCQYSKEDNKEKNGTVIRRFLNESLNKCATNDTSKSSKANTIEYVKESEGDSNYKYIFVNNPETLDNTMLAENKKVIYQTEVNKNVITQMYFEHHRINNTFANGGKYYYAIRIHNPNNESIKVNILSVGSSRCVGENCDYWGNTWKQFYNNKKVYSNPDKKYKDEYLIDRDGDLLLFISKDSSDNTKFMTYRSNMPTTESQLDSWAFDGVVKFSATGNIEVANLVYKYASTNTSSNVVNVRVPVATGREGNPNVQACGEKGPFNEQLTGEYTGKPEVTNEVTFNIDDPDFWGSMPVKYKDVYEDGKTLNLNSTKYNTFNYWATNMSGIPKWEHDLVIAETIPLKWKKSPVTNHPTCGAQYYSEGLSILESSGMETANYAVQYNENITINNNTNKAKKVAFVVVNKGGNVSRTLVANVKASSKTDDDSIITENDFYGYYKGLNKSGNATNQYHKVWTAKIKENSSIKVDSRVLLGGMSTGTIIKTVCVGDEHPVCDIKGNKANGDYQFIY